MRSAALFLLSLFLFQLFSRAHEYVLSDLHLPQVTSTLALAALVLSGGLRGMLQSPIARALFGLSLWLALAVPFSLWRGASFDLVTGPWSKSVAVFVLIVGSATASRHVVRLFHVITAALLVTTTLALTIGQRVTGRLSLPNGSYSNPNDLAFAMIIGALLWWFIIHNQKSWAIFRIAGWGGIAASLYVILETGSRAALLTVIALTGILFWRYSAAAKIKMAAAGGILAAVAIAGSSDVYMQRIQTLVAGDQAELFANSDVLGKQAIGSTNQRLQLLRDSIALTLQNPVFGVGPGTFEVGQQQAAESRGVRGAWRGTHNTYTQISSEAGIPALLLFVAVIYLSIRDLRRVSRLNATTPARNRDEMAVALSTLELLWWAHVILFPFYHLAYSVVTPSLAGLTVALTRARRQELLAAKAKATRTPVATPAPRGISVPVLS